MEKEIGNKIKEVRRKKNLTLAELSKKVGISVSFLSQIENGKVSLTLLTLSKIAAALEIPMKDFFEQDLQTEQYVRDKKSNRLEYMSSNYKTFHILSGRFPNRLLDAFYMTMEPHFDRYEELEHTGEEFYYILNGTASFCIDGAEHIARKGESIHFPSTHPHRIINREDEDLEMIGVIIPTLI